MVQTSVPFADYDSAIRNGYEQRLRITFPGTVFDEENVYSDGIEYTEILNSDTDLTFGKSCCSCVKIPLVNNNLAEFDFQRRFTVELGVDVNGTMVYAPLGVFIGEKPKKLMQDTIELVGYDLMTLFDTDAKQFIESITYPTTIGAIFDSLCQYVLGTNGNRTQALNASRVLSSATLSGDGVTCRDVLTWIAEACGCYARMSRTGVCELVWYNQTDYAIDGNNYFDIETEEFTVPQIDQVRIQVTEADVGVSYPDTGSFDNSYPVYDNPMLYASTTEELTDVAQALYTRVSSFESYKPCNVNTDGNWLLQCGDIIQVTALDDEEVINLPIFAISLKWMGRAEIVYQSTGSETRTPFTSAQKATIRQNYKIHEFIVELDEFKSEILNTVSKTYVQETDPRDNPGITVGIGDFWVKNDSFHTWGNLQLNYNWEDLLHMRWEDLYVQVYSWDGSIWVPVSDTSQPAILSSSIDQTQEAITLEVARANAAEGELSAKITITAEEIKSEIYSVMTRTYVQDEDPCDTVGKSNLNRGDFWITGSAFDTWDKVKGATWEGFAENSWQDIEAHTWSDLMPIVRSWNGDEWVIVADATQPAILSSKIEQTKELIALEVKRANAAEGELQSHIDMTAESIMLEVDRASQAEGKLSASIEITAESITSEVRRATSAEGTLQSNITQTAEDIRLGVKSAGKVSTVGSYILIESNKVTVNSGGDIEIKSGGTFTVASNNFKIDSSGNVTMSGKVTSSEGQIGGWYIGTDYIGNRNTKASSSVGLHALTASEETSASSTYVIWAGNSTQSNANFSVMGDGTVTIKKGSLSIGGTSSSPNFAVDSSGNITIKKGSIDINSGSFAVDSSGNVTIKRGSIDINSGNFAVNSSGDVTIKRGSISIGGTTASPNFAVDSSGNITIKYGSININSGNFEVTSAGAMTAKSGTIAGWTIGTNSLYKLDTSGTTVVSHVGMTTGSIAFYAGKNSTASDCAFKVTNTGQVYLTDLYTRVVDTSAAGYNEDDPTTWTWIDSKIDLGQNAFKIGTGYNTIASYNSTTGKVRLSNGQSFSSATAVTLRGTYGGNTIWVDPVYSGSAHSEQRFTSTTITTGFDYDGDNDEYYITSYHGGAEFENTHKSYKLGFSSSSYSSSTYAEVQTTAGARISNTSRLALSGYWNKAQNSVAINDPTWASDPGSTGVWSNSNTATFTTNAPTQQTKSLTMYVVLGDWSGYGRYVYLTHTNSDNVLARTYVDATWVYNQGKTDVTVGGSWVQPSSQVPTNNKYQVTKDGSNIRSTTIGTQQVYDANTHTYTAYTYADGDTSNPIYYTTSGTEAYEDGVTSGGTVTKDDIQIGANNTANKYYYESTESQPSYDSNLSTLGSQIKKNKRGYCYFKVTVKGTTKVYRIPIDTI